MPGRFVREDPDVAGYEGIRLARAALNGDQAALDEFHDLAGLALPGVTEYSAGVRLALSEVDDEVEGLEVRGIPVRQHGVARAVFQPTNQGGHDGTCIDAAELVAWIHSPEGRAALARRSVVVPILVTEGPKRDRKLLALLDAARELADNVDLGPMFRANALDTLEAAVRAWTVDTCPICSRRGDHEWEELTHDERLAHEAEAASQGI